MALREAVETASLSERDLRSLESLHGVTRPSRQPVLDPSEITSLWRGLPTRDRSSMINLRDRKALDVVADQTTLDRVARGVQTVLGIDYIDAVHAVQDTAERLGTQASAGQVLDAIGAAEAVPLVRVLEVDAEPDTTDPRGCDAEGQRRARGR